MEIMKEVLQLRISTNIANTVSLQYANGEVMFISDGDIAGLQIKYECTGNIHINVPLHIE